MKVKKSNIEIVKSYLKGERPIVVAGYTPLEVKRKEGEQWTDSKGILWEQRHGYKIRVNKQAEMIKEYIRQKCQCGQDIQYGNKLDNIFYRKTGKCFDCIIKEETELRILGVFEYYEKYKLLSNYLGFLEDMKQKVIDSINFFKEESKTLDIVCNSEGFIEKFQGMNTTELLQTAKKDLKDIKKTIKTVKKDKLESERKYYRELKKAKERFTR